MKRKPRPVKRLTPKLITTLTITLGLVAGVYLVLRQTGWLGKASGVRANLVVDMGSSYAVPGGGWRNLAQGGEEADARMLSAVLPQLKALNPGYIRIDHLFDYYSVVGREGGKLTFNWSKLDLTLNDITSVGARPFVALSYMPPVLTDGDVTTQPRDWSEWEAVVQAAVEHISGTANLGISDVYYEVWNEPDLFGQFKVSGEKNYFDLYLHSALGVSRARGVQRYKLGGPATTGLYKNWVEGLMRFASNNNLRLDFVSWHRYSTSLEDYENDYLNARGWLERYPRYAETELVISEAGPNSANDEVYDNSFGAIHAIATAALLENDVLKYFNFEIKDGPGNTKLWGRWGLLTHEKWGAPEAKPRYRALQWLNAMRGNKVNVVGEGSWVRAFAKDDGKIIRLLVVNYDPAGRHTEMVPIKLVNLPKNNYLIRRLDYGGKRTETPVLAQGGVWAMIEEFKPNSAAILEIIPQ